MNLDEAISAHVAWKTKLRSLIDGKGEVDPKVLGTDNQCALGKWIYGEGAKYANDANFKLAKEWHTKFHTLAGIIATKAKAGAKSEAGAMLDGADYGTASTKVVGALMQLKKTVV
jgi:hypothetical protein